MKFTNGYWLMRQGVTPYYAVELHEVQPAAEALTVYACTKKLKGRGDTLDQPLLTVRYSSPLEGVIRVQMHHHKGRKPRKPGFELKNLSPKTAVQEDARQVTFSSGPLAVRIQKTGNWLMEFIAGEQILTASGWRGLGFVDTPEGRFVHEQLNLGVGEHIYGLGERFTPFIKNGQVVELWNEDGGTSSEQAYKNVPFYLTNRGYGVFINHSERVALEIGSEKVERVQFSVPGEELDYFVIYGPTPKEILQRYTALTGRPALPPAWSFGLWLSTSFTTDYNEKTVTSFIQGMADRDIPLHVFHFDCFWMKEFHWVDLSWDERAFPDPVGMLARLKERGLHICLWINPYIAQKSPLFDEGMENGYLVKRTDGSVWQWDRWQAGMALVDFTNPAASQWYAGKLKALLDMGVDCFKTDFGERIPTDVVYHDGADTQKMHNYYTFLYNKVVFELLEETRGQGEAMLFARSATAGSQQFPVHWGGDNTASFESMAETLRGGLSLGLSGFGFWSHDIGGFEQTATPDLYKRWCAFGLLSSHSRLHGSQSYRVPWLFDEEASEVLRRFTKLKSSLMPYLFKATVVAHETGVPMLRAMLLDFPNDPTCEYLDRQYMLGDSLLVAPVFRADGVVDYYLPAGQWTNFLSGQVVEGGRWVREQHDYMSLPLLVRPNSVIPVGSNDTRPDYNYADGVSLHVFGLENGSSCAVQIPTLQGGVGATATVSREGSFIYVRVEGQAKNWDVILRNIPASQVQSVDGGAVTGDQSGARIAPNQASAQLVIHLK